MINNLRKRVAMWIMPRPQMLDDLLDDVWNQADAMRSIKRHRIAELYTRAAIELHDAIQAEMRDDK